MITDISCYDYYEDGNYWIDHFSISSKLDGVCNSYEITLTIAKSIFQKAASNFVATSVWALAVIRYSQNRHENIAKNLADYYAVIWKKHVDVGRVNFSLIKIIDKDFKWLNIYYPEYQVCSLFDCVLCHLQKLRYTRSIKCL